MLVVQLRVNSKNNGLLWRWRQAQAKNQPNCVSTYLQMTGEIIENNTFFRLFLFITANAQIQSHHQCPQQAAFEWVPEKFRCIACNGLRSSEEGKHIEIMTTCAMQKELPQKSFISRTIYAQRSKGLTHVRLLIYSQKCACGKMCIFCERKMQFALQCG